MKHYYALSVKGKNANGTHIIHAHSENEALAIRERYEISNPRYAKGNLEITCKKLNLRNPVNKNKIEMVQEDFDGIVWGIDKDYIFYATIYV